MLKTLEILVQILLIILLLGIIGGLFKRGYYLYGGIIEKHNEVSCNVSRSNIFGYNYVGDLHNYNAA